MRNLVWAGLVMAVSLVGPAVGRADVKIQARVGFPAGGESSRFKIGSWTPVYVTVTNDSEQRLPPGCRLITEAPDSEDVAGQYAQILPELGGNGGQETVLTYTRVGNQAGDVTLTVKDPSDHILGSAKARRDYQDALGAGTSLYLALGSPLPDLRTALTNPNQDKNTAQLPEFAFLSNARDLPRHWFGYQGVDLVVLTTSETRFVEDLLQDSQGRKEALAEWVRRGGRLVISVSGEKHVELRADLLKRLGLVPFEILAEPARWDRLTSVELWVRRREPFVSTILGSKIETARLQLAKGPTRRIDVLVRKPDAEGEAEDRPLVVQASAGLGRVVVTAFDLDTAPFIAWNGKDAFWRRLESLFGTRADERLSQQNRAGWAAQSNELKSHLQDSLETFEEVPVVSFGWVALFILLYIIVVGPLDYWFLKRVVKRLELTWITFPAVVLTISVVAYFTAYYLKGNELKINKIDLVDLFADADPDGQATSITQAYGTTWFTLFSPHIKHYTVGIEPAYPGWATEADANQANPYAALVSTMDRPDVGFGGMSRQGSGGLFRRAYEYDLEQGALVGVPLQVWSTKTFAASWQRRVPRAAKLFSASLRRDDRGVHGWIESQLPAKLQDAVLFYNGEFYPLDDLESGQRVADLKLGRHQGNLRDTWFQNPYTKANVNETPSTPTGRQVQQPACALIKGLLFHEADPRKDQRNSSLHNLDQGWRLLDPLHSLDEAILVARTAPLDGAAEDVTQNGVSVTRLWLDQVPGSGQPRPHLAGTLAQETYVRVYIPIIK
jgi:hypothetical protein